MSFVNQATELTGRTGLVGWVLLGMSVVALAIFLLKLYQFRRLGIGWDRFRDSEQVLRDIQRGDDHACLRRMRGQRHPEARLLATALQHRLDETVSVSDIEDELLCVAERELEQMEWGFRSLTAVVQLSPLLGLLGTVLGMIHAFAELEAASEQASPALLAGGIWQALLTTAMGLAIAIPTRAVLYYFEAVADRTAVSMQHSATRVLQAFRRSESVNCRHDAPWMTRKHWVKGGVG